MAHPLQNRLILDPLYNYLFNDEFIGGAVNSSPWTITDTESKISLDGASNLSFSGGMASPATTDPELVLKQSIARRNGLTAVFQITPGTNTGSRGLGFSKNSNPAAGTYIAIRNISGGIISVLSQDGENIAVSTPALYSALASLLLKVVIKTIGALFYISKDNGATWIIVWTTNLGSTSALYPVIYNYSEAATVDYVRVYAGTAKTPAIDALAAAPTLVYGDELVVNGNVESWASPTNLNSWSESIAGTSTVNQETSVVYEGSNAVRLDIDASNSAAQISQGITTTVGGFYLISAYIRAGSDAPSGKMNFGTSGDISFILSTSYAKKLFTSRATATATSILANRNSAASNSVYFDLFSITNITWASCLSGGGDVGTQYGVFDADVTVAANYQAGIMACLDSAGSPLNFLHAYLDRSNSKVYLTKTQTTTTDLTSGTVTYSAGAKLRLVVAPGSSGLSNAQVGVYYNSVIVGTVQTVDLSSGYGTLVRAFDTSAAATLDLEVNI